MTPVVLILIVANVGVFMLEQMTGALFRRNFALWPLGTFPVPELGTTVGFEFWQIVTAGFLHADTMHLAVNMFGLYMFGRDVEGALGSKLFAWLYGASVVTGNLAQLLIVTANLDEGIAPTVGASGGVFGVLLAFGALFPKRQVMLLIPPIPMPAWVLVTGYGLISLFSGVFGGQQNIAHFAHLGGMVGAALVLLLFSRRRRPPTLGQ